MAFYIEKSDSEIVLTNAVVCYIDFLGVKNAIKSNSADVLNTIHSIYSTALLRCNNDSNNLYNYPIRTKIFSDNVIFACEIPNSNDVQTQTLRCLCSVIRMAQYMQILSLQRGLLIRGAITIGDFYIDNILVWGNSLVEAYGLEDSVAIFPRIILSEQIMQIWEQYAGLDFPNQVCNLSIYTDVDGIHYINYLKSYSKGYDGMLQTIKKSIIYYRKRFLVEKNARIKQKYAWQLSYLNMCLDEHNLNNG